MGLFLGTAVHDTSQVVGAALTYSQLFSDPAVVKVAAVTKLTRNLFLAAVIPGLVWAHARQVAALAPAGGTAMMFGWLWLAVIAFAGDALNRFES